MRRLLGMLFGNSGETQPLARPIAPETTQQSSINIATEETEITTIDAAAKRITDIFAILKIENETLNVVIASLNTKEIDAAQFLNNSAVTHEINKLGKQSHYFLLQVLKLMWETKLSVKLRVLLAVEFTALVVAAAIPVIRAATHSAQCSISNNCDDFLTNQLVLSSTQTQVNALCNGALAQPIAETINATLYGYPFLDWGIAVSAPIPVGEYCIAENFFYLGIQSNNPLFMLVDTIQFNPNITADNDMVINMTGLSFQGNYTEWNQTMSFGNILSVSNSSITTSLNNLEQAWNNLLEFVQAFCVDFCNAITYGRYNPNNGVTSIPFSDLVQLFNIAAKDCETCKKPSPSPFSLTCLLITLATFTVACVALATVKWNQSKPARDDLRQKFKFADEAIRLHQESCKKADGMRALNMNI